MVSNTQTQELKAISACGSEQEANAVFNNLASLFVNTYNIVHKVPLPLSIGFVDVAIVSAGETPQESAAVTPAQDTPQASAAPPAPVWPPDPQPNPPRFKSAEEFQAETIAMMNGEIPMDGLIARDADDPMSEGGAVSL